jgi:pimeloyl-ACP methyl ester carboxylesterase
LITAIKARVLLLICLLPIRASADALPGIPDCWTDCYVYANGIRIHYYHATPAPKKPVIVMVHGVTDNGLCWANVASKFDDSYDIYMLDTRGHGLTDPFASTDDRDTLVKDVVEFVRVMNFEKPILMGHSMGAATVMRIGAEYPDLAQAIIMLDPFVGRDRPGGRRKGPPDAGQRGAEGNSRSAAAQRTTSAPDRLTVSMSGPPETLVAQNNYSFDDLVATCRRQSPKWNLVACQYWALSKKQYHGAYSSETWQAMSGVMATGNSLAKIPVPALILKADAPPKVRQANDEAAKVMQHGKLVHIDGTGHNLHHDELERTAEELAEFLSTL